MARRTFGSIRKLASGRWQARYENLGRSYARPFAAKADAAAWLSTVQADLLRGAWVDPSAGQVTVDELADEWLASNPTKRPTTRAADEQALRVHILPVLGVRRIGRVTPHDVQALVNGWAPMAAARTVRRRYGVLRAVLAYALARDMLARSPCRGIKLPPVTSTRRHRLEPDDVHRLARATPETYRPLVWVGALLGLRWSECAGLRVGDIDLLRKTVTVVNTVTRDARGCPVTGPPKSRAGARTFAVPEALIPVVAEHLRRRGLTVADAEQLLFEAPEGGPLRYANWRRRVWLPAVAEAGCIGAGFHDLRRANASELVASGVDVRTAQIRLGHSDPRLTLAVYAQASSDADRAAADKLGERYGLAKPARSRREHPSR
ncbi:MAG: site-specific integrase [Actinomycetota bacterium]|nr:site-specific integrase [Actinomycetota bacterium]